MPAQDEREILRRKLHETVDRVLRSANPDDPLEVGCTIKLADNALQAA